MKESKFDSDTSAESKGTFEQALAEFESELKQKKYNCTVKQETEGMFYVTVSQTDGGEHAQGEGSSYRESFRNAIDKLDAQIIEINKKLHLI